VEIHPVSDAPERILSDLRRAVAEDGFLVTTSAGTRTASRSSFPITVPGTFITPSGLATMGFGPAAVLGVKMAHPHRAAVSLVGDGGFSANPSVVATAMEADLPWCGS
jgi:acetolactate synthase-1/2/3 large subunit